MPTTIEFTGYSDDAVCVTVAQSGASVVELRGTLDEFYVTKDNTATVIGNIYDTAADEMHQFKVVGLYDGCWQFAVGKADEGIPFPEKYLSVDVVDGDVDYTTILRLSLADRDTLHYLFVNPNEV